MPIRETLFGDMPLAAWPSGDEADDDSPWGAFVRARLHLRAGKQVDAINEWRQVLAQPDLEPRHYLQAWHFLRQHGEPATPDAAKHVLGVVIEVAMPEGVDLLAAYSDYSARYFNYSGAGVVWERPDSSLDAVIDPLLEAAAQVVAKIGPWEEARPPAPPPGEARMSFLTPSGLHFGQGPMDLLAQDPLGGKTLELGASLMQALTAKTEVD